MKDNYKSNITGPSRVLNSANFEEIRKGKRNKVVKRSPTILEEVFIGF